jgi:hypothetical protein
MAFSMWNRTATASVIKQDDVDITLIEDLQVMGIVTASRSAMQEKYRFASQSAAALPKELMAVVGGVVAAAHP